MKNGYLLQQLLLRDFKQKYKGTVLGFLWPVIIPLFMMVIYTFVFSVIFQARWTAETTNNYEYALVIFCGLSSFNMLSEIMGRATTIISGNVNYVKKVIFPLEMLPFTITVTAFVNCLISYGILLVANLILTRTFFVTSLELVFLFIPLFGTCLGIAYALSAMAVYYKDIGNAIGILTTVLLYVSPVFYSLKAVPVQLQMISAVNPLSYIIENARQICLYGEHLNIQQYICSLIVSAILLGAGFLIFKRAKDGFADVL